MEAKSSEIVRQLKSPAQIVRPWPANLTSADEAFFAQNRTLQLESSNLLHLKDVSVLDEGVVFKGLRPYEETFVGPKYKNHNWRGLLAIYLKYPVRKLSGAKRYVLAHHAWSVNYYHWLIDVLPRLVPIQDQLVELTLLLPATYNAPYHLETLAALGVKDIEWLQPQVRYQVPDLLVPTRMAHVTDSRPEVMQELRSLLLRKFPVLPSPQLGERIYVSRDRAPRRKVLNEQEVTSYMRSKGFAIVYFEDYTLHEQISIAAQARFLVSIHGAGLTNMLFMPPDGSVLELQMQDDGSCYYYYALSTALGLHYFYQFCQPDDPQLPVNTASITVDIPTLVKNIEAMLAG